MEYKISIVLQFFVKKRYLETIITKLLDLNISNYNIIFWQDSLINSKYYKDSSYVEKYNKVLFLASESVFFDAKKYSPTPKFIDLCKEYVNKNNLNKYYSTFNFVPSSCFCTSKRIWKKVGYIRGQGNCASDLCYYFKQNDYKTIMPVVPCCKDLGMIDPDGYSATLHGIENVRERKNTYLTNNSENKNYELFPYNADALHYLSCQKCCENDTNLLTTIN